LYTLSIHQQVTLFFVDDGPLHCTSLWHPLLLSYSTTCKLAKCSMHVTYNTSHWPQSWKERLFTSRENLNRCRHLGINCCSVSYSETVNSAWPRIRSVFFPESLTDSRKKTFVEGDCKG